MNRYDVTMLAERLREHQDAWREAARTQRETAEEITKRLLFAGAANRMGINEMASLLGMSTKDVRVRMRRYGLNPSHNRTLLAASAASALAANAEALGLDPTEVDLTSPLAYLPMGEKLLAELRDAQ